MPSIAFGFCYGHHGARTVRPTGLPKYSSSSRFVLNPHRRSMKKHWRRTAVTVRVDILDYLIAPVSTATRRWFKTTLAYSGDGAGAVASYKYQHHTLINCSIGCTQCYAHSLGASSSTTRWLLNSTLRTIQISRSNLYSKKSPMRVETTHFPRLPGRRTRDPKLHPQYIKSVRQPKPCSPLSPQPKKAQKP